MSDQTGGEPPLQPEDLEITFEGGDGGEDVASAMGPRPDQRAMGPRPDQRAMGPRPDQRAQVMGPRPDQRAQGVGGDIAGLEDVPGDLVARLEAAVARIEAVADRLERSS